MPYIRSELRASAWIRPEGAGPLCYAISKQVADYRLRQGDSFATFAEILAALEATKLEFYRRVIAPYEDKKCVENGDVFNTLIDFPAGGYDG